jgi:5-aminopentanamidase
MVMDMTRIALLHLSPVPGALDRNAALAEKGIAAAAASGARWIITPELCLTGYDFTPTIGTAWIDAPEKDVWFRRFAGLAKTHAATLFFGHPERDAETGNLYNSLFVIGSDGRIIGRHRKINTQQGAESWSVRGRMIQPVDVEGTRIGLLLCADAYTVEPARNLAAMGCTMLLSGANWAPEPYGPDGCWERRSLETGLPVIVCNRTGMDKSLDFTPSESVVIQGAERVLNIQSDGPARVLLDWDHVNRRVLRSEIRSLGTA